MNALTNSGVSPPRPYGQKKTEWLAGTRDLRTCPMAVVAEAKGVVHPVRITQANSPVAN